MFLLVLASALAATHEVEVSIDMGTTTYSADVLSVAYARRLEGVAEGIPDMTIASDSPYVSCVVDNGDLRAIVRVDPNDFPTLPTFATCTYGSDSVRVYPVVNALVPSWGEETFITSPLPNPRVTIKWGAGAVGRAAYQLPVGPAYQTGTSPGMKSKRRVWTGLSCKTVKASNDRWYTWVIIDSGDTALTIGTCQIPTEDGSLALTIDMSKP